MNTIYKVIFNHATQTWVAVSELQKAKSVRKSVKTLAKLTALLSLFHIQDVMAWQTYIAGEGNTETNPTSGVYNVIVGLANTVNGHPADIDYSSTVGTMSSNVFGDNNTVDGHHANAIGGGITVTGERAQGYGDTSTVNGTRALSFGVINNVTGNYSAAFGAHETVTGINSTALGSFNNVTGNYSTALGQNINITVDNAVAIGKDSSNDQENTVSFGNSTNARRLVYVANGVNNTDAVNLQQLNAVNANVDKNTKAVETNKTAIQTNANAISNLDNTKADKTALAETNANVEKNTKAVETNKSEIASNKENIQSNADAISNLATTKANVADVYIKSEVYNKVEMDDKLTSLTGTTPAVINQVNSNQAAISQNRADIQLLNSRVNNNSQRINKLDRKVNHGLAQTAALAGLMQPMGVGKSSITAAVGGYNSATAVAAGMGYRINEKLAVKTGVSFSTSSKGNGVAYNAGISYEW